MVSKFLAGAVAVMALTVPILAHAQTADGLKLFDEVCLATKAKGPDVVSKARGLGFVRPPTGLAKQFASAAFPNAVLNWRVVDEGFLMILSADGAVPFDDEVGGDVCAVIVVPADQKVSAKIQEFLGVAKTETTKDGLDLFIYENQDGKHRPVSEKKMLSMTRSMEGGRLRMVMTGTTEFSGDERASMMMLVVPRPTRVSLLDR